MEIFALKTILCSGICFAFYRIFLAKEKTLVFNRFYLLFSLIFSLGIPFIKIQTGFFNHENQPEILKAQKFSEIAGITIGKTSAPFDFILFFKLIYAVVAVFFILKFLISLLKIKKLKGEKIIYKTIKVILLKENTAPFSFWKTIYLSKNDLITGEINESIFRHEELHIRQLHSIDLLTVEILKALFWFNPFIYLYRKAMVNNHEFLADECVIKMHFAVKSYQQTILSELLKQNRFSLTHQFNYNSTKKRFIMMTVKNSKFAKLKNVLSLPLLAGMLLIFSEKVYAGNILFKDFSPDINILKTANETVKLQKSIQESVKNFSENAEIDFDTVIPRREIPAQKEKRSISSETVSSSQILTATTKEELPTDNSTPAEYPGGIEVMRQKMISNINTKDFKGSGFLRSSITFNIDKNGDVSDIKTMGENEQFNKLLYNAIKISNENVKWKPASKNGVAISYNYRLPVALHFENNMK